MALAATDDGADADVVLDALDDEDARRILRQLEDPMTASELSESCDIPLSTTYRKLELLTDAALLEEGTELRADGHHTTTYDVAFEEVRVWLAENREVEVAVERLAETPDERLVDLWTEVRRET